MRRSLALIALIAVLLLPVAACGGGDGDASSAGSAGSSALAERLLRLAETPDSTFAVLDGKLPDGLSEALNPAATAATAAADRISLVVHPDGKLIGSFKVAHRDGSTNFYLLYDVPGEDRAVQATITKQLGAAPWQVTFGRSTATQSVLSFTNSRSADVTGTAYLRSVGNAAQPVTSVVYLVQVAAPSTAEAAKYALPAARNLPDGFPLAFLQVAGMTVIDAGWAKDPTGDLYHVQLLTLDSAQNVLTGYRALLTQQQWQTTQDSTVGFASTLAVASRDGRTAGTITIDTFSDDESYTSIVLDLQAQRSGQ